MEAVEAVVISEVGSLVLETALEVLDSMASVFGVLDVEIETEDDPGGLEVVEESATETV